MNFRLWEVVLYSGTSFILGLFFIPAAELASTFIAYWKLQRQFEREGVRLERERLKRLKDFRLDEIAEQTKWRRRRFSDIMRREGIDGSS